MSLKRLLKLKKTLKFKFLFKKDSSLRKCQVPK